MHSVVQIMPHTMEKSDPLIGEKEDIIISDIQIWLKLFMQFGVDVR